MAGRPRRACRRCNTQKVRCTGLRPICHRCQRLGYPCIYENTELVPLETQEPSPETQIATPEAQEVQIPTPAISQSPDVPRSGYCGIPADLMRDLINIYFSHIYNASLLLDQDDFVEHVRLKTAKPQILLSVCALASKFYRNASGHHILTDSGFGREWANSSASIAAAQLGDAREENITTFLNLALFWYSEGEWRKSFIYKWNGIQIAYVLGIPAGGPELSARTRQAEFRRRSLWACVCMMLFGSKAEFVVCNVSDILSRIPLPIADEQLRSLALNESDDSESHPSSLYGFLVHILSLWDEVYQSTKKGDAKLDILQSLHSKLERWEAAVSARADLAISSMEEARKQSGPLILLLHTLYDQCLCTLHSSIVPLFSWGKPTEGLAYARQNSAQVAYEHACSISTRVRLILQSPLLIERAPSFFGYAAYSSCAIQIPFLWCSKPEVRACAFANMIENLRCIQEMGKYWKFIALLGINIQKLYMMHEAQQIRLEDEPKYLSPESLLRPRNENRRAQASILSHNEIVWQKSGSMAQKDTQITDLEGGGVTQDMRPLSEASISSFIEKISQNDTGPIRDHTGGFFDAGLDPWDGNLESLADPFSINQEQLTSFDGWLDQFSSEINFHNQSR